jgi:hypothetical protein
VETFASLFQILYAILLCHVDTSHGPASSGDVVGYNGLPRTHSWIQFALSSHCRHDRRNVYGHGVLAELFNQERTGRGQIMIRRRDAY